MLVDDPKALETDGALAIIAAIRGLPLHRRERQGVYEIGHFGGSHFLRDYEHYPQVSKGPYGVADDVDQIVAANPELSDPQRQFVVTFTRVRKATEAAEGGWRWHKWGEYIGTKTPTREYLHDEPEIDEVLVFSIYEKKVPAVESDEEDDSPVVFAGPPGAVGRTLREIFKKKTP